VTLARDIRPCRILPDATPDTETPAAILANLHPGQQVPVKARTAGGGTTTVQVTLGQLPGS
jgi:hypothetical protein